jgi:transposase-like protein
MKKSKKFSPEVRERAVRMVQEHRFTGISRIAPRVPNQHWR